MEAEAKSKIHPLVAIASIAVIIFSAVGVAALTGHLPGSSAQKAPEQAAPAAAPVAALSPQAPASAPVAQRQAKPAQRPAQESVPRKTQLATAPPVAQQRVACADCGAVVDVREVEVKGEGSGAGAVAGGVAGAVIGNQIGSGNTRTVARRRSRADRGRQARARSLTAIHAEGKLERGVDRRGAGRERADRGGERLLSCGERRPHLPARIEDEHRVRVEGHEIAGYVAFWKGVEIEGDDS